MAKDWTSPIYGFFAARPAIEVVDGRRCHEFKCAAPHCKGKGVKARIVRRYLDKADRGSTSNMHKHAKNCWGTEIVSKALQSRDELTIKQVRKSLSEAKIQDGTITALFERNGKENVSFSTKQHTYMETRSVNYICQKNILTFLCRVECVRWVAESMRSMKIVDDPAFHRLMKTGRPQYKIPSGRTVARDVHVVFRRVKERITKMLKVSFFF
jgi:hypothetical protein